MASNLVKSGEKPCPRSRFSDKLFQNAGDTEGLSQKCQSNLNHALILLPEKVEIGLKVIERHTLPDIAIMLRDCDILDEEDVKFAQKLNRLRNGLAHRNAKIVSNVILSGRELLDVDLDSAVSDTDYISFAIGTIYLLTKVLEWYEETDRE